MTIPDRLDRFHAGSVAWSLRLYGLALTVDVGIEIASDVWGVHAGRLYPYRHVDLVPLYPTGALAVEWALRGAAGLLLVLFARRAQVVAAAVRLASLALFAALLQRYSNHGALLFLIALFLSLAPPDVTAPSFDDAPHPALGLVRAQLVIVYVFTALNKLLHGFTSGASLGRVLGLGAATELSRAASWLVVGLELTLPLVLVLAPRAGVALVLALHLAFSATMPNVTSFGLAMLAMAVLFVDRPRSPHAPSGGATRPVGPQ
jgi:hypothetical protein